MYIYTQKIYNIKPVAHSHPSQYAQAFYFNVRYRKHSIVFFCSTFIIEKNLFSGTVKSVNSGK